MTTEGFLLAIPVKTMIVLVDWTRLYKPVNFPRRESLMVKCLQLGIIKIIIDYNS